MRMQTLILLLALVLASSASAIDCEDWTYLDPASKPGTVSRMIDERLASDVAQRYTSANRVAIRTCLQPMVPRIVAEFDGVCSEGMRAAMNALDETFDRYFLSCVQ